MIEPQSGNVQFASGNTLRPGQTERDFSTGPLGLRAQPGLANAGYRWHTFEETAAQREWLVAVCFEDAELGRISLVPKRDDSSWASFSPQAEAVLATELRALLSAELGTLPTRTVNEVDTYLLPWGIVSVGVAPQDATASIAVRYVRRRADELSIAMPDWLVGPINMADRSQASLELCRRLLTALPAERTAVFDAWNFGRKWDYPSPARLACREHEQSSPRERILTTLVLSALDFLGKERELTLVLATAFNACRFAGLSAAEVFEVAASAVPRETASALRAFLARAPEDQSLAAFRLEARRNDDGELEIHPNWR